MSACPTLTTQRLILRPFRDEDLDAFHRVMSRPEVTANLHITNPTRDRTWLEMAMWMGQWELRGTGNWLLEERATGAVVGRAGLHNPQRAGWPGTEVGWTLHPEVWGRGYATEAGLASIAYARDTLGLREVFSVIAPSNLRSHAVATRLGLAHREDRELPFLPGATLGIWHRDL